MLQCSPEETYVVWRSPSDCLRRENTCSEAGLMTVELRGLCIMQQPRSLCVSSKTPKGCSVDWYTPLLLNNTGSSVFKAKLTYTLCSWHGLRLCWCGPTRPSLWVEDSDPQIHRAFPGWFGDFSLSSKETVGVWLSLSVVAEVDSSADLTLHA